MLDKSVSDAYYRILQEELLPATGCTEPIAIAYCAATARQVLDALPTRVEIAVSGNILKNVKSVVVPNTDGRKGIAAAAAAGIVAGNERRQLQVIAEITPEQLHDLDAFLNNTPIVIRCSDSGLVFDIDITVFSDAHAARVRIANHHTNIVCIERDGVQQKANAIAEATEETLCDKSVLNVRDIVEFADTADLTPVIDLLRRQIAYNSAIAEAGIHGNYGANVGRVLLQDFGTDIRNEARAYAAAGSDARMSGCDMPVVILSGSGNQGITASVPVIRYAKHLGASEEALFRALVVSDLVTIHQKTGIGRLSAFCGAVCAGCGAGAGIAYLCGGGYDAIAHTVVNALAIISGIVCDGAKPSCAAKIATAVEAGILGYHMYRNDQQFYGGDGIVVKGVDNTIRNVGRLAKCGMRSTDEEIIKIMLEEK